MCTIKMQVQESLDNDKCSVKIQQLHVRNVSSVRTKKPTHLFGKSEYLLSSAHKIKRFYRNVEKSTSWQETASI